MKGTPRSPADAFAEAFRDAQVAVSNRSRLIWLWPWAELFGSRTSKQMEVVDAYLDPILEKAVEKAKVYKKMGDAAGKEAGESNEEGTLLDQLARYTTGMMLSSNRERCSFSLDPVILHDEILNIMIAGRDTVCLLKLALTLILISDLTLDCWHAYNRSLLPYPTS